MSRLMGNLGAIKAEAGIVTLRVLQRLTNLVESLEDFTARYIKNGRIVADHTDLLNIGTNSHTVIDAHIASTSNPHTVSSTQVGMQKVGSPTYSTVQHMQDIFHSSGHISGGAISDAGGAAVDIAAGQGLIRASDSDVVPVLWCQWSASTGNSIPSNSVRYIGVEYNSGTPQVAIRTSYNWDFNTDFPLGSVVNEGGTLHINNTPHKVGDHANLMIQRAYQTMPFSRDVRNGGLILGETGTRNVTVTAGAIWERLARFAISAIDTSGADTFTTYYRDGGGGWTATASVTAWPNTQYDNNSGTLVTMTNNWHANLWFYVEIDGALTMLYGWNQYVSEAQAADEAPPSSLPDRIKQASILIGRIIFKKSAATAGQIQSAFTTTFTGVSADSGLVVRQAAEPTATETSPLIWVKDGGAGVADEAYIRLKNSSNTFEYNYLIGAE